MDGVQIVGRLVQQKDVGLFQQKLAQKHLCALAAGQLGNVLFQTDVCKPEGAPDLLYLRIDHIKIVRGQKLLQRSRFFHQRV